MSPHGPPLSDVGLMQVNHFTTDVRSWLDMMKQREDLTMDSSETTTWLHIDTAGSKIARLETT